MARRRWTPTTWRRCGVTALKIEKLEGKKFFWVNGHKLRIYR